MNDYDDSLGKKNYENFSSGYLYVIVIIISATRSLQDFQLEMKNSLNHFIKHRHSSRAHILRQVNTWFLYEKKMSGFNCVKKFEIFFVASKP